MSTATDTPAGTWTKAARVQVGDVVINVYGGGFTFEVASVDFDGFGNVELGFWTYDVDTKALVRTSGTYPVLGLVWVRPSAAR